MSPVYWSRPFRPSSQAQHARFCQQASQCLTERLPSSGPALAHYPQTGISHDILAGLAVTSLCGSTVTSWLSCTQSQVLPCLVDKHGQVPNPTAKTGGFPTLHRAQAVLTLALWAWGGSHLRLTHKESQEEEAWFSEPQHWASLPV